MAGSEPVKSSRAGRVPGGTSGPSHGTGRATAARRTVPTWKAFGAAVAGVLAALEDGQFLILSRKRTNHFVQFAVSGRARLRAEAVSNAFLKGKARLDERQVARLERMGWNPAGRSGSETEGGGSPNFFRDYDRRVKPAAPGELAIATLRTVFGVRRPSELEYRASAIRGGEILLPTLGIAQDRRARKRKATVAKEPPFTRIASREQLAAEVSRALASLVGKETIEPDEDGDFPLRTERSLVSVRVHRDGPGVRITSRVASGLKPSPALLGALNECHQRFDYVRLQSSRDFVIATLDHPCSTFLPEDFLAAVSRLLKVTDEVRPELERRFGREAARRPEDALADANFSAGRATAAWLTGEGLCSATEKLRTREGEDPIPAPLLDQWRQMLLETTTRAVQSADAVLTRFNGAHGSPSEELTVLVDRCVVQAAEAERACRALARLALGVTSHTEWCEETARLERAAVLVLSDAGVTVEEEEVVFLGRGRSELISEAAGLLCWMLTQQRCSQEIGNPKAGRPTLKVIVDEKSNLLIRARDECEAWEAPVTVIDPARYIADFLSEHGGVPLEA